MEQHLPVWLMLLCLGSVVTWYYVQWQNACISLGRTYAALETLTEPHQLTATLQCVSGVSRTLLDGGRGRQVLSRVGQAKLHVIGTSLTSRPSHCPAFDNSQ